MTPDESLALLLDGNHRFSDGHPEHPHCSPADMRASAQGQEPFAVILTCSDSRVPVELIFDQGIGDLFTIRVAGNVSDDIVLASAEYAVDHLGTPIVMVLGHTNCGAVTAAVEGTNSFGHLPFLLEALQPALAEARKAEGDLVEQAIRANARQVAHTILRECPIIARHAEAGEVKVVPAVYHLETGKVEVLTSSD